MYDCKDEHDDLGIRLDRLQGADCALLTPRQDSSLFCYVMQGWIDDEFEAEPITTGLYDRVERVLAMFCSQQGKDCADYYIEVDDDNVICFDVELYF